MRLRRSGLAWALCLIAPVAAIAQTAADYLLVERPDRLPVLNRYEQEATAKDRAALLPFMPLQILRQDVVLSDGYTHAMEVAAGGTTLFLVRENGGFAARRGSPGSIRTVTRALPLGDTITVMRSGSLMFAPPDAPARSLPAQTRLVRLFRSAERVYCAVAGTRRFGWVDFAGKTAAWQKEQRLAAPQRAVTDAEMRHIRERIGSVNSALRGLFARLNRERSTARPAPAWDVREVPGGILCTLRGTTRPESFAESSATLAREIENIMLGSGALVETSPGAITIRMP